MFSRMAIGVALLLAVATSAMAISQKEYLLLFSGTAFVADGSADLIDYDGYYLIDYDGDYLVE